MIGLVALVGWVGLAWSASVQQVQTCLSASDVPCATQALASVDLTQTTDPAWLQAAAVTAFYAGDYPTALHRLERAIQAGYHDTHDQLALYRRVAKVGTWWTQVTRGPVAVRYRPGVDAVLVDDALATLQNARNHLAPLLGGVPPGTVIVELFPTTRSFIACSSLTADNVQTTGVVALSKWSRLLVVSPRSLGRGYGWRDTLAHEYIHLVVSHLTHDKTPVWLQEAIAKYLDNRWRDGSDRFHLNPSAQGLLASALASNELVPFEAMHPSLAKLPSAELASLAYAQLASLMAYCFERYGPQLLVDLLPSINAGQDAAQALASTVGEPTPKALIDAWKAWAKQQHLSSRQLAQAPVVLDGADPVAADPVLASRRDLANFMRLGDLLAARDHPKAALIEYAKAKQSDQGHSPLLASRTALAHVQLGQLDQAESALRASLADYPDHALTHKTLGQLMALQQRPGAALTSYTKAVEQNPFDIQTQQALADLHRQANHPQAATRHARYARILRRGGEG